MEIGSKNFPGSTVSVAVKRCLMHCNACKGDTSGSSLQLRCF